MDELKIKRFKICHRSPNFAFLGKIKIRRFFFLNNQGQMRCLTFLVVALLIFFSNFCDSQVGYEVLSLSEQIFSVGGQITSFSSPCYVVECYCPGILVSGQDSAGVPSLLFLPNRLCKSLSCIVYIVN